MYIFYIHIVWGWIEANIFVFYIFATAYLYKSKDSVFVSAESQI